jgi:uncharacterized protein YegJ (DUF2314 family)
LSLLAVVGFGVRVFLRYEASQYRHESRQERERDRLEELSDSFSFEDSDPKIVAASAEARQRFPEFATLYSKHEPGASYLVELKFHDANQQGDSEWITVDSLDTYNVSGVMVEEPAIDIGHHKGQRVTVAQTDVVDWMVKHAGGTSEGNFIGAAVEQLYAEHMAKGGTQ